MEQMLKDLASVKIVEKCTYYNRISIMYDDSQIINGCQPMTEIYRQRPVEINRVRIEILN